MILNELPNIISKKKSVNLFHILTGLSHLFLQQIVDISIISNYIDGLMKIWTYYPVSSPWCLLDPLIFQKHRIFRFLKTSWPYLLWSEQEAQKDYWWWMSIDLGSWHIHDFHTSKKYRPRKMSLITTITGKPLVKVLTVSGVRSIISLLMNLCSF